MANKPRIRFYEYSDEWEERKLSEITEEYNEPVDTPHNGYERLGIRSHAKGTFHEYVSAGNELETAKMSRVRKNKLIFNITFAWEHAVAITDEKDEGKLVSHRFPQYTLSNEIQPDFFKYVILDDKFRHKLWLSSPGGAGRNRVLNISEAFEYITKYPKSKSEQTAIGALFNNITTLINSTQEKLEKAIILKKSLLEKMFPKNGEKVPELRFKGFSGDWEEKYFGEIFVLNNERNDGLNFKFNKTISIATMTYNEFGNGAKEESLMTYKVLRIGDIAFEGHTNKEFRFGRFVLNDTGDGIMSPRFSTLRPISELEIPFWKQYIHSESVMREKLVNSTKAGTMMNELIVDNLLAEKILVPKVAEQQKIGKFFAQLDSTISSYKDEFEKLKTIKKSLLEKMFV